MPQAENTALARSHSSITTRKTILGSRQQCFWNEGKKKKREKKSPISISLWCSANLNSTKEIQLPSMQIRAREIQRNSREIQNTDTHVQHSNILRNNMMFFYEQYRI